MWVAPTSAKPRFAPSEFGFLKYPLAAFYFIDKPGDYSEYLEVHDPKNTCDSKPKCLRTNTVQLQITPKQVELGRIKPAVEPRTTRSHKGIFYVVEPAN